MAVLEFCKERQLAVIVPEESGRGVWRTAEKAAADMTKTSGAQPVIYSSMEQAKEARDRQEAQGMQASQCSRDVQEKQASQCRQDVHGIQAVFAVIDGGELAERLAQKNPVFKEVRGKRESYAFYLLEHPLEDVAQGLVIYGSDRLGTIYGLFHLSELLGVTPWVYWGDAVPAAYRKILLTDSKKERQAAEGEKSVVFTNGCSKEPSVKYRGFFINDEWPCFGNWTFSHFGGFTAKMYDHVFEYLLRMKGNYIWPAMWTSSFLLDGPGMEAMELADEYGIYVGMSHHEPCMRSGEEFSLVKGEDSPYGMDWSYVTNKEGILRFWEDGLKRIRGLRAFPTIGMRGERDSKMLGEDSEISENVRLLKEIITNQRRMIEKYLQTNDEQVPQLFAVYKEVEDYYFGDGDTQGLRGFEELSDVTLLLCEDNFGNMRALPAEEERNHKGGFGMYYHLDYHGDPVSYEWMPSVQISKIWEQMTQAYEYGIRELWIVNAGDLKFQEYPLGYFMELAYDFETWGSSAPNKTEQYAAGWIERIFGDYASKEELEKIQRVLHGYLRLNGLRRPESLHSEIYHPAHFQESRRMMDLCDELENENEQLRKLFLERDRGQAYESMIYYPAAASINLLKMHLYAGWNHLYAAQGKAIANEMGERMERCVLRDEELTGEIAAFSNGKWSGMELAAHIGFTNWNEEDWRYPLRHVLRLPKKPRLVVSASDEMKHYTNQYFPKPLCISMECVQYDGAAENNACGSMAFHDCESRAVLADGAQFSKELPVAGVRTANGVQARVQIANGGQGTLKWRIEMETVCDWLNFSAESGETVMQDEIILTLHEDRMPDGQELTAEFNIRSGEQFVPVCVKAVKRNYAGLPDKTIVPHENMFVIPAVLYAEKNSGCYHGQQAGFEELFDYGKYGNGIKVFPVTASFMPGEDAPGVTYRLLAQKAGDYCLQLHTSPANPLVFGGELHFGAAVRHSAGCGLQTEDAVKTVDIKEIVMIGKGYKGGEPGCQDWEQAVLNQEHIGVTQVRLEEGINLLTVYAREAGAVLERLVLYPAESILKESYLGPVFD